MANLMDYLDWRGDLTLAQAPFNEVDNLILSELSYLPFDGIVPGIGEGDGVELWRVAQAFFAQFPTEGALDMGVLMPKEIPKMFRCMAEAPRFRDMRLSCFFHWLDTEHAQQFAALTIDTGDGKKFLSFRGTDDTLAGWREDFYMACMPAIPAQKIGADYLRTVARQYPRRRLRLGGHSKGGNVAVYSAVFCPAAVQRRIEIVWSNDGPGFHESILTKPEYLRMAERIVSIIPKSSVVGMLLEHDEDYVVVDSRQQGLFQHDGFSWEVLGPEFVRLHSVTRQSQRKDRVIKEWVRNMSMEQRETFVDALFDVLEASGATTLTDLKEERFKTVEGIIRAMKDMEKDTRDALIYAVKLLFRSGIKVHLEQWQQESEKKDRVRQLFSRKEPEN